MVCLPVHTCIPQVVELEAMLAEREAAHMAMHENQERMMEVLCSERAARRKQAQVGGWGWTLMGVAVTGSVWLLVARLPAVAHALLMLDGWQPCLTD